MLPLDLNPGIYNPTNQVLNGARTRYTSFAHILQNSSIGPASYHSLQVGFERRLSHGLQFQSNFTWARTVDTFSGNSVSFGSDLPNPFDLRYNRGTSDLNIPLISVSNFIYTTPSLKGHNAFLTETLGAWEISGIYTMQSGLPFGIVGGNGNNNSQSQQNSDRADFVSGYSRSTNLQLRQGGRQQELARYFNIAAFTTNAPGTFGNTPRNIFQGPGINTADLALIKNWLYRDGLRLQFRFEMFNAFNRPDFATPISYPTNASFGQITSIGPIAPRVSQAGLKLTF